MKCAGEELSCGAIEMGWLVLNGTETLGTRGLVVRAAKRGQTCSHGSCRCVTGGGSSSIRVVWVCECVFRGRATIHIIINKRIRNNVFTCVCVCWCACRAQAGVGASARPHPLLHSLFGKAEGLQAGGKEGGAEARWLATVPRWAMRWGETGGGIRKAPGGDSTNHFQACHGAANSRELPPDRLAAWNVHGWMGNANSSHRCTHTHTHTRVHTLASKHVITHWQRHTQTNASIRVSPRSRAARSGVAGGGNASLFVGCSS